MLKPGGILNVSDIVNSGTLPDALTAHLAAWASCISGALDEEDYLGKIHEAGFGDVQVVSRKAYASELIACDDGLAAYLQRHSISLEELEGKITSITLKAFKPNHSN